MKFLNRAGMAACGIGLMLFIGCVTDPSDSNLVDEKGDSSSARPLSPTGPGGSGRPGTSLIDQVPALIYNGNDNGAGNGNDNGAGNGNDNGAGNGNDNGAGNGNDNGAGNGNDNGAGNGNDNGTGNGNDNGTGNGNDNGTGNGNDNGAGNGNDNGGGNGNDNGAGNGNDNGGGGDTCPDGSIQVETELFGAGEGDAEYRLLNGGCERFRVRVDDTQSFRVYNVYVNGLIVGQISTDDRGRGELRYEDGQFPPNFPVIYPGDVVDVGGQVDGVFQLNCSSNGNCNG